MIPVSTHHTMRVPDWQLDIAANRLMHVEALEAQRRNARWMIAAMIVSALALSGVVIWSQAAINDWCPVNLRGECKQEPVRHGDVALDAGGGEVLPAAPGN